MNILNTILSVLNNPGIPWITAVIFVFYMHTMYRRQLNDRQKELDRLAADNRDYRDRFERLLDRAERMSGNPISKGGER